MPNLLCTFSAVEGKFRERIAVVTVFTPARGGAVRLHHAQLDPGVVHRVLPRAFEHVGTDLPDFFAFACGKINVPFAVDVMDLGRPDMRFADADPVVCGVGRSEIIVPVRMFVYIGVGPAERKGIVVFSHKLPPCKMNFFQPYFNIASALCQSDLPKKTRSE